MHHNLREPERTLYMMTALKHNSLMSARKFADENYITVMTPEEVLIYYGNEVKLQVSIRTIRAVTILSLQIHPCIKDYMTAIL